jgi:FSR family fosmidomycin resistance protein-like MFS transporter
MVIVLSILIGLIIASAFSAILVYATDLMPRHTGIVAGLFYGLSFGVAGLGSALFGWVADATSIQFVFEISTLLPLIGIIAVFLPKMKQN